MLRKLWAYLTRNCVVALQDNDGEVCLRIATRNPFGTLTCWRYGLGVAKAILNDDGTVSQPTYVKKWIMVADYSR